MPMPPDPDAPGAIPALLHALVTGLRQRHELCVVTVAGPDPAEWAAVDRLAASGIDVRAVKRADPRGRARWQRRWRFASGWLRGAWPWRSVWYYEPALQPLLDSALAEFRPDVIQVEDNAAGMYRLRSTAPRVLTEHEPRRPRRFDWRAGSPRALLAEEDWRRWPGYERRAWQRFDRLVVFTERDAATVREIAPALAGRVRVSPFSVALPAWSDPAREEPGRLLFTGNFSHPPNVDAALWLADEIVPRLAGAGCDATLTVAGVLPPPVLQARASERVRVVGYVPDLAEELARAALIVAPVRIGGGMRMKVLHAMAAGKAVVTTPRGAEGLAVCGEPPPLAIAADADGVAREIARLLADDAARRELGARARAHVERHFSPDACARRLEAIWAEVLAER